MPASSSRAGGDVVLRVSLEALDVGGKHLQRHVRRGVLSISLVFLAEAKLLAVEDVEKKHRGLRGLEVAEREATVRPAALVHRQVNEVVAPEEARTINLPHQLPLRKLHRDVAQHHGRLAKQTLRR